jgi:hypothetical protein
METKTFLVRGIEVSYEVVSYLKDAHLVKTNEEGGKSLMLSDGHGGNIAIKMPPSIEKLDEQTIATFFDVVLFEKSTAWNIFVLKDKAEVPDRFVLCYDKFDLLSYAGNLPENCIVQLPGQTGGGWPSITQSSDVFIFQGGGNFHLKLHS